MVAALKLIGVTIIARDELQLDAAVVISVAKALLHQRTQVSKSYTTILDQVDTADAEVGLIRHARHFVRTDDPRVTRSKEV